MRFSDEYEERIQKVANQLLDFGLTHCMTDGALDTLLLALAAMELSGGNFSCLPPAIAEDAMRLTLDRLGRTYLDAKRIGDMN